MSGKTQANIGWLTCATALVIAQVVHGQEPVKRLSELECYPYVIGTQTFDARYQFSKQTKLVETAQAMLDMGSNTIKFGMGKLLWSNVPRLDPSIQSLTELAAREASHRRVLDMPFAHYLIWTYPFTSNAGNLAEPTSQEQLDREYREIHDFVRHLLATYDGTGKTFYLGHWEGDWILLGNYEAQRDPAPERIPRMIEWLNVRQKAVDDAKRDTPHKNVQVYHYTEVNLVQKAIGGGVTLTNQVLPKTHVDFVSYSSYDSLGKEAAVKLPAALSYIESKLPAKAGVVGKRVFIGEYGFPAAAHAPREQEQLSREVMKVGLTWGCRFVLYWEMYNNEVPEGKQQGFWLIDDKGVKQPVYFTHQRFLTQARAAVKQFIAREHRTPTPQEYVKLTAAFLDAAG